MLNFAQTGIYKASPFHPKYRALLSAASAAGDPLPTEDGNRVLNRAMSYLGNNGQLDELDALWFYAHNASTANFGAYNWIDPSQFKDTFVSTPVWTAKAGFQTNSGTSGYLDSNYAPSTAGVKYTLNSASFGVFIKATTTITVGVSVAAMGIVSSTNHLLLGRNGANNSRLTSRLNADATDGQWGVLTQFAADSMYSAKRDGTSTERYLNGALNDGPTTLATTSIPTGNLFKLCRNSSGSPNLYLPAGIELAAVFIGSKNVNHSILYNAISQAITDIQPY